REPLGSEPDPLPGGFDTSLAVRALQAAGTGVCIADARRPMLPLVWANEAFSDRTGLPLDEIAGGSCRMLQWADTDSAGLGDLLQELREGGSPVVELKHRRRRHGGTSRLSLSPVTDAEGVLTHLIGVHEGAGTAADTQPAPAVMNHDALTGLPNRVVLRDRLGQALGRLRRREGTVGVLFLDVDGFKQINDRYGHGAGDEFLREVPERLRSALRADDTVARLGGDEFVILLEDCGGEVGALQVAERVLQAFEKPFSLGDETLALRVSMGIAVTETSDESADQMLTNADVAMYRAKHAGGDGLAVYDTTLRARANERLGLARDLRAAIGTDQLSLHYQPIVDLGTERVISVEALVRWDHPVRGRVAPDEFVRLAEETGIIVELGRWVLERACTEFAAALDEAGDRRIELAVNLSPRQLADLGLPALLRDVMARTGLGPGRVALEITETALTQESDSPADRLWALKQEGVRIVLDDFGSGYSSLGHLRRFPIDAIKIDRSFVDGLGTQSRDAAIVGAILPMARALDIEVVAEGVESETKLAHLYALGCRHAQGYLFARPAPMAEIAPLVRRAGSTAADRVTHPELSAHQSRFKAALAAGDAEEAGKAIRAALAAGFDGLAVQAQVIGPALHYIGDEWELGRMGVADEHLATAIAERSLAMVFEAMQAGTIEKRGRVILAAVEGEHHVLGLRMTSDALSAAGFDVVYLGADVPEDSLLKAVARHNPQAVCLTATVPAGARAIVAAGRRLISRHPDLRVVAGGPAVPTSALRRSGVHVAESVEEAVSMVERGATTPVVGANGLAAAG
ncbi:MAG TPA: EAL domain-containing protein, partial [Thermoleophilaceae bacterium]|nr:EAL domain-containing protein [Thermoleophilaceae bacterium]